MSLIPVVGSGHMDALVERWNAAWPDALAAWSRFTRLRPPILCRTPADAKKEGLTGSFAMIRLTDQSVVISMPGIVQNRLDDYAVEILAHEVGHHVYAPATLNDNGRMIARMRRSLPTVERHAPMLANLYNDLLINDRLARSVGLRMADVYRALASDDAKGAVWALYMRIFEILWASPRGSLGGGPTDDRLEGEALIGARLIRSYARDFLPGSGRFAALFLPHLLEDEEGAKKAVRRLLDTEGSGKGGDPSGLTSVEDDEKDGAISPLDDPALTDEEPDEGEDAERIGDGAAPLEGGLAAPGKGQAREPFEYAELLRAMGIQLTDHEAAVRYYRERALPHLIPFPSRETPRSSEPLPEGLEPWDIGHALDAVDWLQSVLASPNVVPGMTTVQRTWGTSEGQAPAREPLDLDLYVDSSGSMANPQRWVSYPALAGAIICLSAFRAGARVQATLWSGAHQFESTPGFVRDETAVLRVLTGFLGGATAFPIHKMRDTFQARARDARPAHIMVISDDGVSTMFDNDERGQSGWDVARAALARARGGGSFVLSLPADWEAMPEDTKYYGPAMAAIRRARTEGWNVHRVASWEDLVEFARSFSRAAYGRPGA